MSDSTSPDLADADDSFRSGSGHFPRVYTPAWVAFHPDLDEGAIAVAVFVAAYRSTSDDTIPFVGRKLIAQRFKRSLDWVDRRTRALCEAGHLHRIRVYRDAVTGERTLSPVANDGTLNPQVTNDWVFSDAPPEGDRHPHPIMSSEYAHPERIAKRIHRRERLRSAIKEGGAAPQRPGSEQGEHQKTAGQTPAAHQRPGGPLTSGRGGRSPAALTETKENGDQINQPRAAASAVDVAPGTGSGGLVGGEEGENDKAAAVLASLPVRTPLPASSVRTLAPHVADLLASGWTPGELTEHWTTGLPASYGVGLLIQRVRDTRPRVRPSTDNLEARIAARIEDMASRGDDSGARLADQMLKTHDWAPPPRGHHSAAEYYNEVLPAAVAQFIDERRDQLADVIRSNPIWQY